MGTHPIFESDFDCLTEMSKLVNCGKLAGHTLFITGASRGIGLSIARKCAADGANIVIAAKTAEPHAKLPGTIYTAADEIEQCGGKALPLTVDMRDQKSVLDAVNTTVSEFGGLDICINNASAISLTGVLQTPMKRYDLMHQINGRGTYLVSQACLPHLLESKEKGRTPHILNNSPPLDMRAKWFGMSTAYTIAKYNMSLCALGMSDEFKDEVAVNTIWPLTAIWTAAMDMLQGEDGQDMCRHVEIMSDAAYGILCEGIDFAGNFCIDEEYLRERHGITEFDSYNCDPTKKSVDLPRDFFLPEKYDEVENFEERMNK